MSTAGAQEREVVWHDLECGSYLEDIALWRELAAEAGGPILDIGCGSGRVTLDLAQRGHAVVGLDRDAGLLRALAARAAGLDVRTICADAREFTADGDEFALVLVPMQTIQLLGGPAGRRALLRGARAHMARGAVLAAAIADALEGVDDYRLYPPAPDVREVGGVLYESRPVAVREDGDRVAIERVRETVAADGHRRAELNVVHLDRVDGSTLAAEAADEGFTVLPGRIIPATDDFVASAVVMLRA